MELRISLCLLWCAGGCGARSFDATSGVDGGASLDAAHEPERQPHDGCRDHSTVHVLPAHASYDILDGFISVRFGVLYCGPAPSDGPILARLFRVEDDDSETILFEGETQPGIPPGWEEFLSTTVPYADGDCLVIEFDPLEEVEPCQPAGRCRLLRLTC